MSSTAPATLRPLPFASCPLIPPETPPELRSLAISDGVSQSLLERANELGFKATTRTPSQLATFLGGLRAIKALGLNTTQGQATLAWAVGELSTNSTFRRPVVFAREDQPGRPVIHCSWIDYQPFNDDGDETPEQAAASSARLVRILTRRANIASLLGLKMTLRVPFWYTSRSILVEISHPGFSIAESYPQGLEAPIVVPAEPA